MPCRASSDQPVVVGTCVWSRSAYGAASVSRPFSERRIRRRAASTSRAPWCSSKLHVGPRDRQLVAFPHGTATWLILWTPLRVGALRRGSGPRFAARGIMPTAT